MAAFSTLVASKDRLEEFKSEFPTSASPRLVASDEAEAIEVALERFEDDANRSSWIVNKDDVDALERFDIEGNLIGWSIYAGGHEDVDYFSED